MKFLRNTKKSVYTNEKQYEEMVQFMSKHIAFSKGYLNVPDARNKSNKMCVKIAFRPTERDVKDWKKVIFFKHRYRHF